MKRYIIIIIVAVAFIMGFVVKCSFTPAPVSGTIDTIRVDHGRDSLKYIKERNSLINEIKHLQQSVTGKDHQIMQLRKELSQRIAEVKALPVPERVQCFMNMTGGGSAVGIDSTVMGIPVSNVDSANVLIMTGQACAEEKLILMEKVSLQKVIISTQEQRIASAGTYINELEKSYHGSQDVITDLQKQIKKENRKRKWSTGILAGSAAVLIGLLIIH